MHIVKVNLMPKLQHIPDFYCYNCNAKIDIHRPTDSCEKCQEEYWHSFDVATRQNDKPDDYKGWAYYLLAQSFAGDTTTSNFPDLYSQMISYYWSSAFLGNQEAKQELARLFEDNDDKLSLATASFLAGTKEGWAKEHLKKTCETDPQKLFEIAQELENNYQLQNHREFAYKFYRKVISSRRIIGTWEAKAIVGLTQMLLFDKIHRDDMYQEKIMHEPQLGAEIAFWLDYAKQTNDEQTRKRAVELTLKAKDYFSNTPIQKYFCD